jgi:hypothetical protein
MKPITAEELKRLAAIEENYCISIYMPQELTTATRDKQRIRLKNLLQRAEKSIDALAPGEESLRSMLYKGWELIKDDRFRRPQAEGLAIFMAPQHFETYQFPMRSEESFAIMNRFNLKPLLPLFMADGHFYLLALSLAEIRLFTCTSHHMMAIDLPNAPDGLDESLQYDDKQQQLQFHTGAAAGSGDRPAMFHGHGVGIDDRKNDIQRYFRDVDRAVNDILAGEAVPLVLAGLDHLLPIFRQVTGYGRVMPEAVSGNPDGMDDASLHEQALAIVRPALERDYQEAQARFSRMAGKGYTSCGVRSVVPAAAFGQVETLFVNLEERRPGRFDRSEKTVYVANEESLETEDLMNLAAVETICHGGTAYALPRDKMPEEDAAAVAILRY